MLRFRELCVQILTALLLGAGFLIGPPTAQAQLPDPVDALLSETTADASETVLVRNATALLAARTYGEITFRQYRAGVDHFRANHPDFYGAFFGDPFYYRAENVDLVQQRQVVNLELSSWTSFDDATAFRCHPYAYDPYFARYNHPPACRGFQFPVAEFSVYPSFFAQPGQRIDRVRTLPPALFLADADDDRKRPAPSPAPSPAPRVEPPESTEPGAPDSPRPSVTDRSASDLRPGNDVGIRDRASDLRTLPGLENRSDRSDLTVERVRERIREAYDHRRNQEHWRNAADRDRPSADRDRTSSVHRSLRNAGRSGNRAVRSSRAEQGSRSDRSQERSGSRSERSSRSDRGSR